MHSLIRFIIFLLICSTSHGEPPSPLARHGQELISHIHDKDQLGTPRVRALAQDKHGFLWIGSEHGLFRYDGYDFKAYRHDSNNPHSIIEDKIYALLAAKDGRLWIGTKSTLSVYDPELDRFSFYRNDPNKPSSLANNEVYRLYEDKNGGIWVLTYDGLSHLPYGKQSFTNYRADGPKGQKLSHSTVFDIIEDRHGKMLVATDGGIDILDLESQTIQSLQSYSKTAEIESKRAYNFFKDSHERIWVGTYRGGLLWLADDDRTVVRGHPSHTQFPALPQAIIRHIIQANEQEIWASVYGKGIAVIDRQSGKFLRALTTQRGVDSSLADNTVHTMLKDKTGLIWIAYLAGNQTLSTVNSNATGSKIIYSHENKQNALDIKEISVMGRLGDEGFLFAGEGLNLINQNGDKIPLPESLLEIDKELRRFSQSSDQNPIKLSNIKTLSDGSTIFVYQDRRIKRYRKRQNSLEEIQSNNFCDSLGVSSIIANHVWFSCNTLSLLRVNLETGKNQEFRMESPDNVIYSYTNNIILDQQETLWVSTEHGLFSLKNALTADSETALHASHLVGDDVKGIHMDKQGRLWADTSTGLFEGSIENSKLHFKRLTNIKNAPQGSFFLGVVGEDEFGRLWGSKGVFDSRNNSFYPLNQADGYFLSQGKLAASYSDKELLFSTANGLISILPETLKIPQRAANLAISNVSLDGKPLNFYKQPSISMKADESTLSVELAILDFTDPGKNRFEYNLQSEQSQWQSIPPGQHSLLFSNLAPGSYTLHLRGTNSRSIDTLPSKAIHIEVLPQWYQSNVFKAACTLLIILALLGFYRLRLYQHKQEKRKLSKLVSDRTQELNQKNSDLEQRGQQLTVALDELMETQEQLLEKEKMAALGELVSGVAHEVNTPLGISVTAASHLHDSSRSLQSSFEQGSLTQDILKQYLGKTIKTTNIILANLNRSSELIRNFKNVSVDQHNEVFSKIQLHDYLNQVLETLSPTVKNSNCKVHFQCPSDIVLHSYPGIIAQLITNLVNNSVQHGCSPNKGGNIYLDVHSQDQSVILIHRDDGVGISPSIKRKIYDPFFTTKRGKGGSGLGLSIVFNLVTQRLGGSITCSSEAPEGAKFEVTLPMNLDKAVDQVHEQVNPMNEEPTDSTVISPETTAGTASQKSNEHSLSNDTSLPSTNA
ncbi:two-component regulator propeller domain-containing protein [uncultured Pseudoteredinibacter sp.]|uniref:two-component regulator propeller domain-containing protein n=1 Tax=uncultured Pseudoteredinibacter sp. TaxID=1641701 RepID=UPI002634E624|nr:two-component regulator propeller domain-containing protein [uncultured Pseudoteredinibacter sp.]